MAMQKKRAGKECGLGVVQMFSYIEDQIIGFQIMMAWRQGLIKGEMPFRDVLTLALDRVEAGQEASKRGNKRMVR